MAGKGDTVVPTQEPTNAGDIPDGWEWQTLDTNLGTEWDFKASPTMVARFFLWQRLETRDPQNPGQMRDANVYQFMRDNDDNIYFVWGSATIDAAFLDEQGDLKVRKGEFVRITFLGEESFTGKNGPQRIKRYRVQVARPRE